MRSIYINSDGWITKFLTRVYRNYFSYFSKDKPLAKNTQNISIKFAKNKDELYQMGFSILEKKLDLSIVKKINDFSISRLSEIERKILKNDYDFGRRNRARIFYSTETLFESEDIQSIVFDNELLSLAYLYLEAPPILDIVTMWWSIPSDNSRLSEEAQLFHFDYDRFKFLKFFFYLTDVTPETGPHCYVKGSHIYKPKEIFRDGRISDNLITRYYSNDEIVEICGKKGTIIAADTSGFHKGKPLEKGSRLLLQIQFCLSKFGQSYESVDESKISPLFYDYYRNNLIHYEPFFNPKSKYLR
ncbi:MAG: phytanoyl-CoA dioxygenase family protein [Candidatus Bathyarchaeia archaeon]